MKGRVKPSLAMILVGRRFASEQTVPNFDLLGRATIATATAVTMTPALHEATESLSVRLWT